MLNRRGLSYWYSKYLYGGTVIIECKRYAEQELLLEEGSQPVFMK